MPSPRLRGSDGRRCSRHRRHRWFWTHSRKRPRYCESNRPPRPARARCGPPGDLICKIILALRQFLCQTPGGEEVPSPGPLTRGVPSTDLRDDPHTLEYDPPRVHLYETETYRAHWSATSETFCTLTHHPFRREQNTLYPLRCSTILSVLFRPFLLTGCEKRAGYKNPIPRPGLRIP